jgi:hypothetical protein
MKFRLGSRKVNLIISYHWVWDIKIELNKKIVVALFQMDIGNNLNKL